VARQSAKLELIAAFLVAWKTTFCQVSNKVNAIAHWLIKPPHRFQYRDVGFASFKRNNALIRPSTSGRAHRHVAQKVLEMIPTLGCSSAQITCKDFWYIQFC